MSESVKQSLSALMDNEADPFEVRRTLQQVDDDSAAVWARYHLASAVLRGETPAQHDLDISAAVQAALEKEPHYDDSTGRGFWKPLASIAVAASVTAMVMFGAQGISTDPVQAPAAGGQEVVLSAPVPNRAELLPAQYGRSSLQSGSPGMAENDVIRLSSSMEYYIHQHHSLMRDRAEHWGASWVPSGYTQVRHDLMPDAEVILYSDGRSAISVSVEPYGKQKARAGSVQDGDTVAFGKRVGGQFVTVVGDLPLMMADRIASSVTLVGQ